MAFRGLGVPRGYKAGLSCLSYGPSRPRRGRMETALSSGHPFNVWLSVWSPMGPVAVPESLLDLDPKPSNPEPCAEVRDPVVGSG